jgi:predicted  nucleic acid-binding Zn-ribbon protein
VSANLLDGATVTRGTKDADGYWVLSKNDGTDKKDSPMWTIDGQPTLEVDQTAHLACSVMPDEDWASDACFMSVQYVDAAGHINWATHNIGAAKAGVWTRLETSVIVPSGMRVTRAVVSNAYHWSSGAKVTGVTISYGSPVTLASSAHTPYATQDHISVTYATKASLKVTDDSIKAEVSARAQTDSNVADLSSRLTQTANSLTSEISDRKSAITTVTGLANTAQSTADAAKTMATENQSSIKQLSDSITSEVSARMETDRTVSDLSTKVTQTSNSLSTEVSDRKQAITTVTGLANTAQSTANGAQSVALENKSNITQLSDSINAEVAARIKTDKVVSDLSTKVAQTSNSLSTEVSDRKQAITTVTGLANAAQSTANGVAKQANLYTFGLGNAGAVPKWIHLGTLTSAYDASIAKIAVMFGDGNNGRARQNSSLTITIKDGWQSTGSAVNACGVTVMRENCDDALVDVLAQSATVYDVWVYAPWAYSYGNYSVSGTYKSWQDSGVTQKDEPATSDTQVKQDVAYRLADATKAQTMALENKSSITQLSDSITSLVKGEATYTAPDGTTKTSGIYSKIEQTADGINKTFGSYTKTEDLASTAAVKDAKKAGTDAASAASAAQSTANNAQSTASDAQSKANNLLTLIRESASGLEIGKSSDGTTFTTTRTKIDEDSFDILDKNGNVLNTFAKTGQTLFVDGTDNFSVRSDPNYQTYVYTDARRYAIDSKNSAVTYVVYGIDLTLAENAILGMYVYTESGIDSEDLKSRITSTTKETDLPSHSGKPDLIGTLVKVSYNPTSPTDKITKYGLSIVALKIKSTGKILALNFGTSNSHVGYGSMTLGYGNLSTGAYSTAFGVNTESHGDNSVAMGTGTYAMRSNSLAVGIYNDEVYDALFSVGNGRDQNNRSNAFYVTDDGSAIATNFAASNGLLSNGTLVVNGNTTLKTLSVSSTASISGELTAGSIKTSGSISSGAITSGDISSGALTIKGSRKIYGIWEGSKVIKSAGQSTPFISASEFKTITGYDLSTAQTDCALRASNGDWNALSGINFTLGWSSNYINIAVNPSTMANMRVNYTFIKFA